MATQRNIGTADNPLMVPEGSPAATNYDVNIAPNLKPGQNPTLPYIAPVATTFNDYAKLAANSGQQSSSPAPLTNDGLYQAGANSVNGQYQANTQAATAAGVNNAGDPMATQVDNINAVGAEGQRRLDVNTNQTNTANSIDQQAFDISVGKANSGIGSMEANYAQGRNGMQSSSNGQVAKEYGAQIRTELGVQRQRLDLAISQRDEALKQQKFQLDQGNKAAAQQFGAAAQNAQERIDASKLAAMDAASRSIRDSLAINADQRAADQQAFTQGKTVLDSLIENGVEITPAMSVKIAGQMGVPTEDVVAYNTEITRIKDMKGVDDNHKKTLLDNANLDFRRKQTGRDDDAVRKMDRLDALTQAFKTANPGATQADIMAQRADDAAMLGLKTTQDPMYMAQVEQAQALAKIDGIKALYEGKEPPYGTKDYWDMKGAEANYNKTVAETNEKYGTGSGVGGWQWTPGSTGMRTDRNNNPIASKVYKPSINLLQKAGLIDGVDFFSAGDSTAGVDTDSVGTIKYATPEAGIKGSIALLAGGQMASWYANNKYGGAGRIRSLLSQDSGKLVTTAEQAQNAFNSLDVAKQTKIVADIYKHEGGKGAFEQVATPFNSFESISNKAFEFFNATPTDRTAILSKLPQDQQNMLKQMDNGNYEKILGADSKYTDTIIGLSSGKSVAEQNKRALQIAEKINAGDTKGVASLMNTSLIESLDAEGKKNFTGYNGLLKQLDAIEALKNEATGLGLKGGTLEDIANKIGKTTDPKKAEMKARISSAIMDFRRAVTGAAFTEGESKAYDALFPGIGKDAKLDDILINNLRKTTHTKRDNVVATQTGERFNTYDELQNPVLSSKKSGNPSGKGFSQSIASGITTPSSSGSSVDDWIGSATGTTSSDDYLDNYLK